MRTLRRMSAFPSPTATKHMRCQHADFQFGKLKDATRRGEDDEEEEEEEEEEKEEEEEEEEGERGKHAAHLSAHDGSHAKGGGVSWYLQTATLHTEIQYGHRLLDRTSAKLPPKSGT
jgi:hypothetical protein